MKQRCASGGMSENIQRNTLSSTVFRSTYAEARKEETFHNVRICQKDISYHPFLRISYYEVVESKEKENISVSKVTRMFIHR